MYLKSIEVYGFKSFANKITFEFKNGITGIVGPNGSGKSNVADAVRWVLGEQSAKQLRGAKMEDVIFSGTESRKPLGSAYVAITLDNSDKSLPVDYKEVTISRRVYRSGESEYLINGTACRLKDVTSLFFDTGIGKEGYSIIGQGQIDKILSGKPEERRELFDEAAGIVKYKKNKAATEKSLEAEKQNLCRVNDILLELEGQVGPLAAQAEIAKQYLNMRDQLKELDVNVFLLETERFREDIKILEDKLTISDHEIRESEALYESTKNEYDDLEKQLDAIRTHLDDTKTQISEAEIAKEKLEGEIRVLNEQINTANSTKEHITSSLIRIEKDDSQRKAEKNRLAGEKTQLEAELQIRSQKIKEVEKEGQNSKDRMESLVAAIETGKSGIIRLMNEHASIKNKLQRYDTMLEQIKLRKTELTKRLLQNKSEESKHKEEIEGLVSVQEELAGKMEALLTKLTENGQEYQKNHAKNQENIRKINMLTEEYHKSRSKLDTLMNMTERYEGYGNSIRKIMEKKKEYQGIHGVVADLFQVEKKYEQALETALGGSIQNIVTDTENTAKQLIEFLKQNRYGRATFLPLTSMKNRNPFLKTEVLQEEGVIGLASELIKTKEEYLDLARHLLGRIVVVEHIDYAILLARKYQYSLRIVTLDGESLNPGGAMTGGAFRNNSNLLGRKRETNELKEKIGSLTQTLNERKEEEKHLKQEKENLRTVGEQLENLRQELSLAQNTNEMALVQAERKQKELAHAFSSLSKESKELESQIVEIESNKGELNNGRKEQEDERQNLEAKIKEQEDELASLREHTAELVEQLTSMRMEYSNIKQQGEFIDSNYSRIEEEEKKLQIEKQSLLFNQNQVKDEVAQILEKIEEQKQNIQKRAEQAVSKAKELTIYEKQQEELKASHKEFFTKREELTKHLSALDKESFRLKSLKEKTQEQAAALDAYMWEEYELTYRQSLAMRREEELSLSGLKKELVDMKGRIKTLGDVNVNAIEDYKNVSERYEFLKNQRDDILQAEENLLTIIAELDTVMRAQFAEKFAEIQMMFDQVFKELFGGGKASLSLIEEEDILTAGIRIVSQPPGKKLQNMMQLSGGEKALTAIALLFAIQSLKPSPFCLLDEIEAALDDSNVERFAQYLHKLTKDTQFIVITHRRGTMIAADVLYGITMQEKGVSTLVSVSLIENDLDK